MELVDSSAVITPRIRAYVTDHILDDRAESLRIESTLEAIETQYLIASITYYRLPEGSSWAAVVEAYFNHLDFFTKHLNKEDKLGVLKEEFRRFTRAKFVQLNKFTSTREEVEEEMKRIATLSEQ